MLIKRSPRGVGALYTFQGLLFSASKKTYKALRTIERCVCKAQEPVNIKMELQIADVWYSVCYDKGHGYFIAGRADCLMPSDFGGYHHKTLQEAVQQLLDTAINDK